MGKLHFDSGVGLATQSRGIVGLNDSLSEADNVALDASRGTWTD